MSVRPTTIPGMTGGTALLIIDVQAQHVAEAAGGDRLVHTLTRLRDRAVDAGAPVFLVQHHEPGFDEGDPGWELAISPSGPERVVPKDTADSFVGTGLDERLRAAGVGTLVVTGYSTEYCVDSTARSALARGYQVVLPVDGHATAADVVVITPEQVVAHHNTVLGQITYAGCSCAVVPAADVVF